MTENVETENSGEDFEESPSIKIEDVAENIETENSTLILLFWLLNKDLVCYYSTPKKLILSSQLGRIR